MTWLRAHCRNCPWQGIPTFLGGRKARVTAVTPGGPVHEVIGAEAQTTCPACGGHIEIEGATK